MSPQTPSPDKRFVRDILPRTAQDAHKYSRGVIGLSTGSREYPGAAALGVSSALATGVGMARYRGPSRPTDLVLSRCPEAVCEARTDEPGHAQAWVIGSGMPADAGTRHELERIVAASLATGARVVADAGALPFIAETRVAEPLGPRLLLTPHAGELEALLPAFGHSPDRASIEADPQRWAAQAAESTGCCVLLKGPTTVVAAPGQTPLSISAGHPWLATAGTGDVLAGVIGALAATSEAPLQELAAAGAWIHGRAGVRAAKSGPFGASALPEEIRAVIATLLSGPVLP